MAAHTKKRGFFRKKSSIPAILFSISVSTTLLALLLTLYSARCVLTLVEKKNLTQSVSVMLDSEVIRDGLADTIQQLAPEDTITKEQISDALDSPEVHEAIGQFGDDLISSFLENENSELDPVETFLEALNDPEQAELYNEALEVAMREAGVSDEDFYHAATLLADELGVEPPAKDSTNMEIATDMLQKNYEKLETQIEPIKQISNHSTTKTVFGVADSVRTWFDTFHFVLINGIILLCFYGLLLLVLRHPWKPFLCIGIPYLLVGLVLAVIQLLDIGALIELPDFVASLLGAFLNAVLRNSITALTVGIVLILAFIILTVISKIIRDHKEELAVQEIPPVEPTV